MTTNTNAASSIMELIDAYAESRHVNGAPHYNAKTAEARAAVAAALASPGAVAAAPTGWRPIETAPKDGTLIVVKGDNHGDSDLGQHHCIASWFKGCWMESSDWNPTSDLAYLTHWMPLPPAPKE